MKKGWPQKTLAEVILDIKDGGTPSRKNPEYFGGDVYWCVVKDIKPLIFDTAEKLTQEGLNNCSAKVWPVDSVIISLGATIGQIGIAKVPTATKQGLAGIVLNKQMMTPEFLAYGLLDQKEYIQSLATGATIKEIRPKRFAETIQLPIPPLAEQQRIVGLLDEAFSGLATAQAHAKKNHQNARALFESHLQSVFTQRGRGWVETTLGDLCIVDWGNTDLTKKAYVDGGHYLAVSAAGCDGRIGHKEHEKYTPVLSAIGAQCGRMFLPEEDFTAIKNTITLTPRDGRCTGRFLYRLLTHVELPKRGAAQPFISKGDIQAFQVAVPVSLSVQQQMEQSISELEIETQRLATLYERKQAALAALKQSLLRQAFTGNL
jgi:type I restriction enzyme S subunit